MIRSEVNEVITSEDIKDIDLIWNLQEMQKIQEMQQNARRQSEKMAALGQLAGGIAHDFNNQLMSIIGNATMIQKTDDLSKVKEYAERIIHISESVASLTKKILMFSRKESTTNEPINLKSVMDNSYTMVESILDKKVELTYKYGASNKMILGDESQIENLIVNLILNSKDAFENSFGKIEVGTVDTVILKEIVLSHGETLKPGEYITLYVEDDGIGINDEAFMKIFEPYFTTKTKSSGTGLGLSVIFGTVKSLSGFINVKSKVGNGTRFEIFLPIFNNKLSNDTNKKFDIKSNLIMLVDDDENVLDVESEILEDLGYDVIKFSKPLEALEYYNENFDNLAFSVIDLSMPIMTGKQLYEEMEKVYKDTKAFFITGYTSQGAYEDLIRKGEVIIQKPFTYEDLSVQIAKIYM